MLNGTSLGSRLISIVVLINVFILLAIGVVGLTNANLALRTTALNNFEKRQQNAIALVDAFINRIYDTGSHYAASVANMPQLLDSGALRAFTQKSVINDNDTLIHRISIQRSDGSIGVLNIPNPLNPNDVNWRVYRFRSDMPQHPALLQALEAGKPVWFYQEQAQYDLEKRPTMSLALTYNNIKPDGTLFKGIVWFDIPVVTLQNSITQILSDSGILADTEEGYTLLIDETGQVITHHNLKIKTSQQENQVNSTALTAAIKSQSQQGAVYYLQEPFYGYQAMAKISTLPQTNWQLVSVRPTSEIPNLPAQIAAPIILVSLTGLLILAWVMNRYMDSAIVQPLQDLGAGAQEIGSGDLRYQIGYQNYQDEIGRLARAMDDMKRSIAHSYDELSRWSRTLEERVQTRTQEVQSARRVADDTAKELREVYDESLLVVNEPQLRPVLNAFVQRLLKLFNASYSSVWLLNEQKDQLLLAVSTEGERDINGSVMSLGEGITGATVEMGKPIRLEDYRTYPRRRISATDKMPFVRTMSVPLMFVGRAIGAVIVGRLEDAEPFTDRDERLLTLFANLVSPSVRNAQLFVKMNEAGEEAARANQVKTRFLASVTHELRTPLNLIINNMDFMKIGAFGDVNDEQVSRLNQTIRSAEHLLYLINDLLDVSKIDAGEMQMFMQPTDIYPLLDDTVDNIYAFIDKLEPREEQVELIIDIEDGLPVVPMDSRRIRQVLTNLLTNAVKFTREGSVTLTVRKAETGIEFRVQDTGIGIPESEMGKLFAAFERTQEAKESNIEGTGLGLPISQYLVREHGGELHVESVSGEGSTFWFILPFEQTAEISDPEHHQQRLRELLASKPE